MSGVLAGTGDTLELVDLLFDIYVMIFLAPHLNRSGVHGAHFGCWDRGDVRLNGQGQMPVVGNRDTGAVNRAPLHLHIHIARLSHINVFMKGPPV